MSAPPEDAGRVEQLQSDVEQNRRELGQTVDALSGRLDVKSRTKRRLGSAKARVAGRVAGVRHKTPGVATDAKHAAGDGGRRAALALAVPAAVALVTAAVVAWRVRRH